MAIQNFDKLNIVKRRSEPYEQYFGVMKLTPKQRKRREKLARDLEDIFYIFFDVMQIGLAMGVLDEVATKQELTYMLYDNIAEGGYFENEEQLDKYVQDLVNNTYDSTVQNMAKYPNDVSELDADKDEPTPYWVSDDRAMFISENEANTLYNSKEFVEASEQGYTHKIWMSYGDDRVRVTHQIVDGAKVPIGVYFDVGAARMLYPKDVSSEFSTGAECPEEVIGCRCSVKYV